MSVEDENKKGRKAKVEQGRGCDLIMAEDNKIHWEDLLSHQISLFFNTIPYNLYDEEFKADIAYACMKLLERKHLITRVAKKE